MKTFSFLSLFHLFAITSELAGSLTLMPDPKESPRKSYFAKATYSVSADISMSPYAGGEDLLFPTRLIERAEGWFFSGNPVAYSKRASARAWRLGEEFLIWLPLNYFATVVQHEVFGHGYRARDLNRVGRAQVAGYDFGTPPPYGGGGGGTSFGVSEDFTTTENAAISAAGVEATAILANLTKFKWIESGKIDPRQVFLYLFSQYDLPLYIGTIDVRGDVEGHDMRIYCESVNYTYPKQKIRTGRLKTLAWINLADPFTYYSVYSLFRYISSGKETKIPMIVKSYLPGLRLGLTPFGPEVFFENYFRYQNLPLYWYLKGGRHAKNDYYGLGFYGPRLCEWKLFTLGFRFDIWSQPKLLLNPGKVLFPEINLSVSPNPSDPLYSYEEQSQRNTGTAASVIAGLKQTDWMLLQMEVGGKSNGFLPGYSLRPSLTFRMTTGFLF